MSVMQTTLLSATGSFGLASAEAMLRKVQREYARCETGDTLEDRRDAAINGAITLWHISDWVWAGIARTGRDQQGLRALLGVSDHPSKGDLVKWAVRQCPELDECQAICNGSKHVVGVGIQTQLLGVADAEAGRSAGVQTSGLVIVDGDGGQRDVLMVLLAGLSFWANQATSQGLLL